MKHLLPAIVACMVCAGNAVAQRVPDLSPVHRSDGEARQLTMEDFQRRMPSPPSIASNTTWTAMGNGLVSLGFTLAEMDGDLYALHWREFPNAFSTYQISKWNGSSWDSMAVLVGCCNVYAFASYRHELYIGGFFRDVNGMPGSAGIIRWDGSAWKTVGGGLVGSPFAMVEFEGELYVGGEMSDAGGLPGTIGIARWNGTRWASVGGGAAGAAVPSNAFGGDRVYALTIYRGRLYAGGWFAPFGTNARISVASYKANTWTVLPGQPNREITSMEVYCNELYVHGPYITRFGNVPALQLGRWTPNGGWRAVGVHGDWSTITDLATFDGKLYAAGAGYHYNRVVRWNGTRWDSLDTFDDTPNALIVHDGSLITTGWFQFYGATPLNWVARLCEDDDCDDEIAGNMYLYNNGNCTRGYGDAPLQRRTAMLQPGPYYVSVDADGHFAQKVPPGAYTVSLVPKLHWDQACTAAASTRSVNVTGAGGQSIHNDFASAPVPGVEDLGTSITSTPVRPEGTITYGISLDNVGTVPMNGTLTFRYDPRLNVVSTTLAGVQREAGIMEWNFADLVMDETRSITVVMNAPATISTGTTLNGFIEVKSDHEPDAAIASDDRDSTRTVVAASSAPNEMSVASSGRASTDEHVASDSVISYTIRFQNTGADTAFRVVVVDTLSPFLDPGSIRFGAATHPYTYTISGKGIITWIFDDIMLPASSADEGASHGAVKFFVRLRPNLAEGTNIRNSAAISFDDGEPFATNTVTSTLDGSALDVGTDDAIDGVILAPNPAQRGMLSITAPLLKGGEIIVFDMRGARLFSRPASGADTEILDISALASGTYIVSLPLARGAVTRRVVVTQ